jgi:hypothetical protein
MGPATAPTDRTVGGNRTQIDPGRHRFRSVGANSQPGL